MRLRVADAPADRLSTSPEVVGSNPARRHDSPVGFTSDGLDRGEDVEHPAVPRPKSGRRRRKRFGRLTTCDYNVVMNAVSVRFKNELVYDRLREAATVAGISVSALAERMLDEALRQRDHPLIVFRDGPTGRRASLVVGPDVWEVVAGIVGGDVPEEDRIMRAAELMVLPIPYVEAAMRYYADFTEEIDARIAANEAMAERELELWKQQQALLAT